MSSRCHRSRLKLRPTSRAGDPVGLEARACPGAHQPGYNAVSTRRRRRDRIARVRPGGPPSVELESRCPTRCRIDAAQREASSRRRAERRADATREVTAWPAIVRGGRPYGRRIETFEHVAGSALPVTLPNLPVPRRGSGGTSDAQRRRDRCRAMCWWRRRRLEREVGRHSANTSTAPGLDGKEAIDVAREYKPDRLIYLPHATHWLRRGMAALRADPELAARSCSREASAAESERPLRRRFDDYRASPTCRRPAARAVAAFRTGTRAHRCVHDNDHVADATPRPPPPAPRLAEAGLPRTRSGIIHAAATAAGMDGQIARVPATSPPLRLHGPRGSSTTLSIADSCQFDVIEFNASRPLPAFVERGGPNDRDRIPSRPIPLPAASRCPLVVDDQEPTCSCRRLLTARRSSTRARAADRGARPLSSIPRTACCSTCACPSDGSPCWEIARSARNAHLPAVPPPPIPDR